MKHELKQTVKHALLFIIEVVEVIGAVVVWLLNGIVRTVSGVYTFLVESDEDGIPNWYGLFTVLFIVFALIVTEIIG